MNKIIEALSKLLPEEQVKEVAAAVEAMINEAKADLEKQFNTNLEEAYTQLAEELKKAEGVAEQGYQEAYGIISELRNRLDTQQKEAETALEEGFEEAYQMLLAERGKKEGLEASLYEEYDKKLAEMKEYMIDKIDEFLQVKGKEIYENARRDIVNDPRMVEHKVALGKIIDTVSDYISDDDYSLAINSKLEKSQKEKEELLGRIRLHEARSMKQDSEIKKLNEAIRHSQEVITESATSDKKERVEKAKNATGSGKKVTENIEVIGEHQEPAKGEETVTEGFDADAKHQWQVLSGLKSDTDAK
jgi:hypothetical protein